MNSPLLLLAVVMTTATDTVREFLAWIFGISQKLKMQQKNSSVSLAQSCLNQKIYLDQLKAI